MQMKISEITGYLEELAPLHYQESYDNSGLIVGDVNRVVSKVLISLDCTEAVVQEAVEKGCNLIISHHPIVFAGLKKITGRNYVERTIISAIKNDIALYAIHTNLDNIVGGVSSKMAERLGLNNPAILRPKSNVLKRLVVYTPRTHVESVRQAMFDAGAGGIGHYDQCSYNTAGYGTFRPLAGSAPTIGRENEQERVEETKIEVIFPAPLERKVLIAMLAAHPYEEVAHHVLTVENTNPYVGSGVIGNLSKPMQEEEFLAFLKQRFSLQVIRHTEKLGKPIERVALCGGAGGFLLEDAKRSGADIFITADYKYHEFFDAEGKLMIADIGHFESERFTQELLLELITKKFANFAVLLTEKDTNPIKYYS